MTFPCVSSLFIHVNGNDDYAKRSKSAQKIAVRQLCKSRTKTSITEIVLPLKKQTEPKADFKRSEKIKPKTAVPPMNTSSKRQK